MIFKDINIKYGDNEVYTNYELNIEDKKITAILGPSGIGKTSLLQYISKKLIDNNMQLSYVFQEYRLVPWKTSKKNLDLIYDENCIMTSEEALDVVGLKDCINKYPYELSGGMKQRINLARAIMKPGEFMILDEPFKSLDKKIKKEILLYLKKLIKNRNITCVFVTHDIEEAEMIADKIVYIKSKNEGYNVKTS